MTFGSNLTARARLRLLTVLLFVGLSVVLVTLNYAVTDRLTKTRGGFGVGPTSGLSKDDIRLLTELTGSDPTSSAAIAAGSPGSGPVVLGRPDGSLPTADDIAKVEKIQPVLQRIQERERNRLLTRLLWSSGIALAAAGLIAWYTAGRIARAAVAPLHRITGLARTLSGESLHKRIALVGPDDELKELADTFDGMLGRLEAGFESRRSFGAYASHELRTPLATLKAEANLVLANDASPAESQRLARAALATVERADRLVSSLLTISRAEIGIEHTDLVDVAAVAGDVAGALVELADKTDISLDVSLGEGVVLGDESLLLSLIHNLAHNAIQYNVAGGSIALTTSTVGADVIVEVTNTGAVLTEADIDEMSQPFRRLPLSRIRGAGHGLGTAIVTSVAHAHGGTAMWQPVATGGVRAVVTLPSAKNGDATRELTEVI
jgi:signal transduction histidine kinase